MTHSFPTRRASDLLAFGGPARARTLAAPDATAGGDALGGAEIEVAGNEVAHHCSPGCMSMPDSCVDLNANTRRRPARASPDGENPTHARIDRKSTRLNSSH